MNTAYVPTPSTTWTDSIPYGITQGTTADALVSREVDEDQILWDEIEEAILSWYSSDIFDPMDRPATEILNTALDFVIDQKSAFGAPAPSNVVPSGSGQIAFEWNTGNDAVILEFTGLGVAVVTKFKGNRVVKTFTLIRNPRSRKLEIED